MQCYDVYGRRTSRRVVHAVGKYGVEIEESEKAAENKSVKQMNDSW